MEIRARTLLLVLILVLLVYLLWTYGIVERAVARVEARVQAMRGVHASTATVKPAGAWQPAPDVIGTLFLAHCHGYMAWPFHVRPATGEELAAIAQDPDTPAVPGLLGVSRAFFIPRNGEDVAEDVRTWVNAHRDLDCHVTPWQPAALKRLPTPDANLAQRLKRADAKTARRLLANIDTFRVFAVARSVLRDDEPFWELRFYATER